jgi:hypothetical protein
MDKLLGQEAKTFAKRLAVKFAGKWQKPSCSQACGHVKAAVCATHLCLHGSRVPAHNASIRFLQQEGGAGHRPPPSSLLLSREDTEI